METLLTALRAAAEPTRLRILAACAEGELTVSELTRVLGQSQPRVSRHLKLLVDAGLLERQREGSWVFHRLCPGGARNGAGDGPGAGSGPGARGGPGIGVAESLLALAPLDDAVITGDRNRLREVKAERARAAAKYFRRNAAAWDRLRSLHVDDGQVEKVLRRLLPAAAVGDLLDVGTGTGRMLEIFGPRAGRAVGIDLSPEMLAVARANLSRAGLANCSVRQADLYQLPFAAASFDAVTVHQVLHFLDRPAQAMAEVGRVLRPGGRLLVVDFAPHDLESLRSEHAHRRLGFSQQEVARWLTAANMEIKETVHLAGDPLTVTVWAAARSQPPGRANGNQDT